MVEIIPGGYNDLAADGNVNPMYRRPNARCIEQPCDEVPGTAWGPYWCVRHNIERIDRITAQLERMVGEVTQ